MEDLYANTAVSAWRFSIYLTGIKPDLKKVQGILDIGRPATTAETRVLINIINYYRDIWPRRSRILAPMTEADSDPKGRK